MEACFQRLEELFVARSKNNNNYQGNNHSHSHHHLPSSGCGTAVSSEWSAAGLCPQTGNNNNNNYQVNNNNNREDDDSEDGVLLRHALEFFYLWVTFAPLSRGR
jgi:hypothetical protein